MAVPINPELTIPLAELEFRATPAGGPGGQHVNRSSTRIELWWDVAGSPSLTDEQRALLFERLHNRLDGSGRLRIVSAVHRSQARNRDEAVRRFRDVVARGLVVPRRRKPTRPSRASVERRLAEKRKRAEKKDRRRPVDGD